MDIVRVWNGNPTSGGIFNGTAFFINDSTLITAKHVLEDLSDIYLNELPNGGVLPISKDDIVFCERDIAIIKLKRRYEIDEKRFTYDIKLKQRVEIRGYFDENSELNNYTHNISGYLNQHHTFSIQHFSSKGISGSPVFLNDKICGIAQARDTDKNITYIIPIEEVFREECLNLPEIKKSYNALTTIPPKNENFVGRKDELKKLKKSFTDEDSDNTVHIVNGIGGVGKSDLALEYLHQNLYNYENIIFIDLTEGTLQDTLSRTLRTTQKLQDDDDLNEIIRKLQKLDKQNLIVIDNITNKEDFEKIRPLKLNFDILITTRHKDNTQNELNLDVLNPEDAEELFLKYYTTDEDITDVLKHLDYHSLFIELTAKTLNESNITLSELREKFKNGEFAKIDRDFEKTFNDYLLERFKIEDNETLKLLLQRLAIFPSIEINFKILSKSFNDDKLHLKLNELSKRGWLSKKADSYKLHQIIREFILENYKPKFEDCEDIIKNIFDFLNPNDAYINLLKETDYIPIIESILTTYKNYKEKYIANLLDSIASFRMHLGNYADALIDYKQSFEIRKKIFNNTHPDIAKSFHYYASIYNLLGKQESALEYQFKANAIYEENLDDKQSLADNYNNFASIYNAMKKNNEALKFQIKAIEIKEKIYDEQHPSLAISYNNISAIYQDLGKIDEALKYQIKAIEIQEEIFDDKHQDLATSYNNISSIYEELEQMDKSLLYQLKAIDIQKEIFDKQHPHLGISYHNLSMIYIKNKNCKEAKEYALIAIEILNTLNYEHPDLYHVLTNLKNVEAKIKKANNLSPKRRKKVCIDL